MERARPERRRDLRTPLPVSTGRAPGDRASGRWRTAPSALAGLLLLAVACVGCGSARAASADATGATNAPKPRFKIPKAIVPGFRAPRPDPAKVAIGERLFLETRFSQFFFARAHGDANAALPAGDAVVERTPTTGPPLPGPFAGFAINCRSCHFVNEFSSAGRGNRTYADFARRSPVPAREDGQLFTARNSPPIVNALIPREHDLFLHFDGEFVTGEDLVKGTFTGRNFGWLPGEQATAVRHIAQVIREDDGRGPLAREFGGYSYQRVFAGTEPELGEESERFRLPEEYRVDVRRADDGQVLSSVAALVTAYMDSLFFSRDETAEYDSSPYDWFIETNQIPRKPDPGQSALYYNRNVLDLVSSAHPFRFTRPGEKRFKLLRQEFRFGPEELLGMKIFFTMARYATNATRRPRPEHGIGNCVTCHVAPDFTDFKFHNTGAAQEEYDGVHGAGAFGALRIPGLAERNADEDRWLPATARRPRGRGPFLGIPAAEQPGRADLGLWNVFANPDQPLAQPALRRLFQGQGADGELTDEERLPRMIAVFKTPSVRGLGLSEPYLHTGRMDSLEEVIRFYLRMSSQARAGMVRNAAPELAGIFLREADVAPLAAFLRSLNEDYE